MEQTVLITLTEAEAEDLVALGIKRYEEHKQAEVEWLTRKQVAIELGVSIPTLARWAKSGNLVPDGQFGRAPKYSRALINKFMKNN